MLLAIDLKHNFVENSSLFYVAFDLRNNLECLCKIDTNNLFCDISAAS